MQEQEAVLLRVYVSEGDTFEHKLVYEYLVEQANRAGLAGATVLRGILGYGRDHHMHSTKVLRLSDDLPLVVEIVGAPEKIAGFLPTVEACVKDGLITKEKVKIVR